MANLTLNKQPIKSNLVSISDDAIHKVDYIIKKTFTKQDAISDKRNICIDALKYHFESPGQKVRAKICLEACTKLDINYDDMLILAATSELLHNASLIHDDIQDKDEVRRGQATVWKKYGIDIGLCAGDFLISAAYGLLAGYSKTFLLPKLISTVNKQSISAIEGQSLDILFKINPDITIEEYAYIAKKKSGALLSLPIELALTAAEKFDYINLARKACASFAVGYQIADDLDDVAKDSGDKNLAQSVNIIFVLKATGCKDEQLEATNMCHRYLDDAIYYATQLPNSSGSFLVSLAVRLKDKTKS